MQYGLAATVIRAIEDFLRGPGGLVDGGQEAAAEVRRLRKSYPETVMHPASDVPGVPLKGEPIDRSAPDPSMLKSVLAKRLLNQLLGKHSGAVSVSLEDSQWWHVSLFRKVVVTDASEQGVRVREYQADVSRRLLREAAAVCLRLLREGPQVAHQYREAVPSLTSRENWRRLFADTTE
jgi:galactofuranosylgalactofuranosylrhamnosyl-N-acetylglucosaminyl-diphospho-decaprenol beta-1,5/1,6-galactofuranosyltransferase